MPAVWKSPSGGRPCPPSGEHDKIEDVTWTPCQHVVTSVGTSGWEPSAGQKKQQVKCTVSSKLSRQNLGRLGNQQNHQNLEKKKLRSGCSSIFLVGAGQAKVRIHQYGRDRMRKLKFFRHKEKIMTGAVPARKVVLGPREAWEEQTIRAHTDLENSRDMRIRLGDLLDFRSSADSGKSEIIGGVVAYDVLRAGERNGL